MDALIALTSGMSLQENTVTSQTENESGYNSDSPKTVPLTPSSSIVHDSVVVSPGGVEKLPLKVAVEGLKKTTLLKSLLLSQEDELVCAEQKFVGTTLWNDKNATLNCVQGQNQLVSSTCSNDVEMVPNQCISADPIEMVPNQCTSADPIASFISVENASGFQQSHGQNDMPLTDFLPCHNSPQNDFEHRKGNGHDLSNLSRDSFSISSCHTRSPTSLVGDYQFSSIPRFEFSPELSVSNHLFSPPHSMTKDPLSSHTVSQCSDINAPNQRNSTSNDYSHFSNSGVVLPCESSSEYDSLFNSTPSPCHNDSVIETCDLYDGSLDNISTSTLPVQEQATANRNPFTNQGESDSLDPYV